MSLYEDTKLRFLQRGLMDKVKYLENLHNVVPPSAVKRIQQNDKTILNEVLLPAWLKWDVVYSWATTKVMPENGRRCIFCDNASEIGIAFREKWMCDNCVVRIKDL